MLQQCCKPSHVSGRCTIGKLGVGEAEQEPLAGKAIQMRRLHVFMSIRTDLAAHVVCHQVPAKHQMAAKASTETIQDVRFGVCRCKCQCQQHSHSLKMDINLHTVPRVSELTTRSITAAVGMEMNQRQHGRVYAMKAVHHVVHHEPYISCRHPVGKSVRQTMA